MEVLKVGDRANGHLQPLTRSDETPCEHHGPGSVRERRTPQPRTGSVRNHTDRVRVDVVAVDETPTSSIAHHDGSLGQS